MNDMQEKIIPSWLDWLKSQKQVSQHTLSAYLGDFHQFMTFFQGYKGSAPSLHMLLSLTTTDFRAWLSWRVEQGGTSRSTARALSSIRNLYKYLDRQGYGQNKALAAIRTPRIQVGLPRPLSVDQVRIMIDDMGALGEESWVAYRNQALFLLLYGCGLRIGEALSLNQRDAPNHDTLLVMGKGRRERVVPVLPAVQEAIRAYLAACCYALPPEAPLFFGEKGERLRAGVAQKVMRDYRRLCGLPESATPHALRHSCASHLMGEAGDLRGIQELLGHASLSSTQVYTDVDAQRLLKVYDGAHPRARKGSV